MKKCNSIDKEVVLLLHQWTAVLNFCLDILLISTFNVCVQLDVLKMKSIKIVKKGCYTVAIKMCSFQYSKLCTQGSGQEMAIFMINIISVSAFFVQAFELHV